MKQLQQQYAALLAVQGEKQDNSGVHLDCMHGVKHMLTLVILSYICIFSVISHRGGVSEHLLTAQALRDAVKENEAFLYNPAIMPTMTSPNNNQPHNQKNVTQSHKNSRGPL